MCKVCLVWTRTRMFPFMETVSPDSRGAFVLWRQDKSHKSLQKPCPLGGSTLPFGPATPHKHSVLKKKKEEDAADLADARRFRTKREMWTSWTSQESLHFHFPVGSHTHPRLSWLPPFSTVTPPVFPNRVDKSSGVDVFLAKLTWIDVSEILVRFSLSAFPLFCPYPRAK